MISSKASPLVTISLSNTWWSLGRTSTRARLRALYDQGGQGHLGAAGLATHRQDTRRCPV